ncbi:MAG: heme exporter protein CcmB [bacterium]|nr:heme exporter protein CcmB [bacterium]
MRTFLRSAWTVAEKDLLLEWRARESLTVMVIFALMVLTLFSFAFGPGGGGGAEAANVQAGILWIAILFASTIGLSRGMGIERESEGISAMRLTAVDPSAIFLGKMFAVLLSMALMEVVGFAALAVFYRAEVFPNALALAGVALEATIGIAALGSLFSAVSVRTRTRDVLLPVLLFPILVPVLIAAVRATAVLLGGGGWAEAGDWVKLLLVFDIIFVVASAVVYEFVILE